MTKSETLAIIACNHLRAANGDIKQAGRTLVAALVRDWRVIDPYRLDNVTIQFLASEYVRMVKQEHLPSHLPVPKTVKQFLDRIRK
jgi:hypothetical protein